MPKMGESVAEATIISWQKKVGDKIEIDETVVEIATDKVDSEIPSEVNGTIKEILFDVVGNDDLILCPDQALGFPEFNKTLPFLRGGNGAI